jgi:iron(III) transport system substrate-binding protein
MSSKPPAFLGILVLVSLLAACARAPAPTGSPQSAPTSADPSQSEWARIVEAAKREGQISLLGQTGEPVSEALAEAFQRAYPDIKVDYNGMIGAQMVTKILNERAAGLYSVDVVVHGTTSVINGLLPESAIDPIAPALVGPDADPTKFRGGAFEFADEEGKYALLFLGGLKIPLVYNPGMVRPDEITSYRDLLDPKFKGKIAMLDPRIAGAGLASSIFMYTSPDLGKDYMAALFKQDIVITKDDRQLTDWIARGQYSIGLASNDFTALDMKARGVPIESLPAHAVKEGTYVTAAWGSVALLNRAPHPNAARVYLNWLLSKEGQEGVAQAAGYPSRRLDTSKSGLREGVIPRPDVEYRDLSKERYIQQQEEVVRYMRSLIPE